MAASVGATRSRSASIKVGVLTLFSIALLVVVLIWLRGRGLGGHAYSVLFPDVAGMREGASVQMMGIRVGFVDTIVPVESKDGKYHVRVNFNLSEDMHVSIPRGSTLSIETSGIIGEQFLEITPPQLHHTRQPTTVAEAKRVHKGMPVKMAFVDGPMTVGKVERVESAEPVRGVVRHTLYFRFDVPGAVMPQEASYEIVATPSTMQPYLLVAPKNGLLADRPDPTLKFTIDPPMRFKDFMEIQLESAEALKITNEKVAQLLSDDTIATLNSTLKNTETLTATATDVLDNANKLFETSGRDLERLVTASQALADNVTLVSQNVNEIIGDPNLKQDIQLTASSIQQSTEALNEILRDGSIQETLAVTRQTSKDASELVAYLRKTAQDEQVRERLDNALVLLNASLTKLNLVLENVDEATGGKDENLKGIVEDARKTSENLRQLSEKLNGRFALFRLLF